MEWTDASATLVVSPLARMTTTNVDGFAAKRLGAVLNDVFRGIRHEGKYMPAPA
jgi:hypothetical protein